MSAGQISDNLEEDGSHLPNERGSMMASQDKTPSLHLDHIHLHVQNLSDATALFQEVLQAQYVRRFFAGTKEIVQLDLGGVKLSFSSVNEERPPGINHLGISTKDLDETVSQLLQRGWRTTSDRQQTARSRIQFVESPEGIQMEILEPLPQVSES